MPLEDDLIAQGIWPLCGVDEAGRGPLAGPVVAAAVMMEPLNPLRRLVRDSKQLTSTQREAIYGKLAESDGVWIGVSMIDAATIDDINILQATMKAMEGAVSELPVKPSCALVDGNAAPSLSCRCITVVRGDQTEPSISAASIVAKVIRDRYMEEMEGLYPGYGFSRHMGYPTKFHKEAILRLGACAIHRRSFRGVS
jgi:ribonuclease HII